MDTEIQENKQSILQYLLHKKWYVLFLILFWTACFLICRPFDASKGFQQDVICYDLTETVSLTGVVKNYSIEQRFTAEKNNLNRIWYTTGTCGRKNQGTMTIELKDAATGKVLAKDKQDVANLPDVEMVAFSFDPIEDSKGKDYIVSFSADSELESCIVLMGSNSPKLELAIVNEEETDNSLRIAIGYHETEYMWLRIAFFIAMLVISLILVLVVRGTDEWSFLAIAISFGLVFTFVSPFPHAMDEVTHFFRSFMISQGDLVDEMDKDGDIGGYVSDNYGLIVDDTLNMDAYLNTSDDWMQPFSEKESFYVNPYMSSYIPVNHAPGAIGIWIGRLFKLDAILVILLGRLTTLAVYIALCFIGIRKAEYYKGIYFVVASLPLGIFMAASYSADPLLIGATIMFISICMKYRFNQEQEVKIHELLLLLLGVALIASSKYLIYVPVLLLFFLIPRKCFSRKTTYILEIVTAVMIIAIFAIVAFYLLGKFNYTEDRNGHVDMGEQVAFLLGDKIRGLAILIDNFIETFFISARVLCFQNWSTPPIQNMDFPIACLYVLVAAGAKKKFEFESNKKRIWTGVLCLILAVLIHSMTAGALYLGYTPVGQAFADGVQSRYMLPIAPLILLGIAFCVPLENKMKYSEETTAFLLIIAGLNTVAGFIMATFI